MVFQVFPKNVESGAAPRSDNGTSNLIILLVKISSHRKSPLILSLHLRCLLMVDNKNSVSNSFPWQPGRKNSRCVKDASPCSI